jgi:hypothetical protein
MSASSWIEANQLHLSTEIARVRDLVAVACKQPSGSSVDLAELKKSTPQFREAHPAQPSALDMIAATFGLTPFERDLITLCAGVELDETVRALCATSHGDPRLAHLTFGLALATIPTAHWSAIVPERPLRRFRLIEVGEGDGLLKAALRIDERVLHELLGAGCLDARLQGIVRPVGLGELAPSQRAAAERIGRTWSHLPEAPAIQLCGDDAPGRAAVAAAACALIDLRLYALRAADVPSGAADREVLVRLWEREALLGQSALLLDCDDADGEVARAAYAFAERMQLFLFVSAGEAFAVRNRAAIRVEISKPTAAEQTALWVTSLGPVAAQMNGQVDRVVTQFNLGPHAIRAATASVVGMHSASSDPESPDGAPSATVLWDACRLQARPRVTFDDLIVPDSQLRALREIALQVRHRRRVYETWGFARKGHLGHGVSVLFAGPSGTGKSMAAEVLARDLELDLYRIDLGQVVSKYIGETEKNLRRIFDAAEEGGVILLFDEADALFGKRSQVRDSHDRYANIEVSYLLQRMEQYRGLAILTTNMKEALDEAFLRRLRFIVQFPFPDPIERAAIWSRIFPPETPIDNLDVHLLSRLNVSGGNIRNIALCAAFLAADANEPIRMTHLLSAARGEYAKLEKTLTDHEIRGWI